MWLQQTTAALSACWCKNFTKHTMAGLTKDTPTPIDITVHQQTRQLEISFSDGASFKIPLELMRVYSPSAEVQGHGPGQETLQTGKRMVGLLELEPVGNYAVKPVFTDGHESGLFSWEYLYHLGANQDTLFQQYEQRLQAAGMLRDAPMVAEAAGSCGHSH
jgi:DUF971 family protein